MHFAQQWVFRCLALFGLLQVLQGQTLQAAMPSGSRVIVLTANLLFDNKGAEMVSEQTVRVTLPTDIANQQQVLNVRLPSNGNFQWRKHPNQVDRFVEGQIRLEPHSTTPLHIQTTIRLSPYDYKVAKGNTATDGNENFLRPTTYVESTATEVTDLAAKISVQNSTGEARLLAAFRYPQQTLKYRSDIDNKGALFGLRNGFGDCTEYAAIFIATARAMGFPARLTSEFNFDDGGTYEQPNHHAAEVFLNGQWIPVDPNLATDRKSAYGFGTTGNHKIVLKRDGSWVWSTASRGVSKAYREANVKVKIRWTTQNL
jgi:transglutaminase-like putative cysteine protease